MQCNTLGDSEWMHAHSKKPISAREGTTITIGQWILTAPVILLLSSDIYSATTFNFFPFYIQCIIHSQQDSIISLFVKSVLFERRGCDDYLRVVIRSVFISASRVWSANILTGVRVILI